VPCDSVTTQSINPAKALPDLVAQAMPACGWGIVQQTATSIQARTSTSIVTWTAGQGVTVEGYGNQQGQIGALTKAYSVKAVTWAAQRAGWSVKQTADNKLSVSRR